VTKRGKRSVYRNCSTGWTIRDSNPGRGKGFFSFSITSRLTLEFTDRPVWLVSGVVSQVLLLLFFNYALQPLRPIVRSGIDVPTFAIMRLHAAEGGTVGEKCPVILPKCRLTRYI